MYVIRDSNNHERVIKRLSKYEKELLFNLGQYRKRLKFRGMYVPIKMLRDEIEMPHRSSMTRLIKSLTQKGLIHTHTKHDKDSGGVYTKEISLTQDGVQVAFQVYRV